MLASSSPAPAEWARSTAKRSSRSPLARSWAALRSSSMIKARMVGLRYRPPRPPDSAQLKQIRVETVQLADMPTGELMAPARVIPNPNRISRLLPQVQGRVTRVMAQLGDQVEQGQPLVELDSPDADAAIAGFLQAQATERQAEATLTKAQTDLGRATALYEIKAIAEKEVVGARNDLAQATAGLEAARALREQARRKLELLGLTTRSARQLVLVREPISGKVIEINVAPGEYRGAVSSHSDTTTAPLMTIADL